MHYILLVVSVGHITDYRSFFLKVVVWCKFTLHENVSDRIWCSHCCAIYWTHTENQIFYLNDVEFDKTATLNNQWVHWPCCVVLYYTLSLTGKSSSIFSTMGKLINKPDALATPDNTFIQLFIAESLSTETIYAWARLIILSVDAKAASIMTYYHFSRTLNLYFNTAHNSGFCDK